MESRTSQLFSRSSAPSAVSPPSPTPDPRPPTPNSRSGFTLVEMLVSVGLTVLLMAILSQVFALVAGTVRLERTLREVDQKVRSAQAILKDDLDGVTVVMNPPRDPADGEGYFEYEENSTVAEWDQYRVTPLGGQEVTGADTDDVIQFTTRVRRGEQRPFVGRGATGIVESPVAEVAYFLRESRPRTGTTPVLYNLYRRQLLVEADQPIALNNVNGSWYWNYDLSARPNRPNLSAGLMPLVNRLGDLTLRENRFAHDPHLNPGLVPPRWPHRPISFDDAGNANGIYDPGDVTATAPFRITWFGRPLLRETADADWNSPDEPDATLVNVPYLNPQDTNNDGLIDGFETPLPNPPSASDRARYGEDVLLTNVVSFNVEAWDPGAPVFEVVTATGRTPVEPVHPQYTSIANDAANIPIVGFGAYADLGYGLPAWIRTLGDPRFVGTFPIAPYFWHDGDRRNVDATGNFFRRTYDTWANYENDGLDNNPPPTGVAAEGGSPVDPITGRLIADGINNDGDFDASGNPIIDEGIDDGFNGADDDGDAPFWQSDGVDNDGNGIPDDAREGINEDYAIAGPGYDDWIDNDGDGFGGVGQALDPLELFEAEAPAPYPVPLSGIRIRIRVLEPGSQQTREFTLIHSFRTE